MYISENRYSPELVLLASGRVRWRNRRLLAAEVIRGPVPVVVALRRLRIRRGLVGYAAAMLLAP